MPKYEVAISYTVENMAVWEVEAISETAAMDLAKETMAGKREQSDRCRKTSDEAGGFDIDDVEIMSESKAA